MLTFPSLINHERDRSKLKELALNYEKYPSMPTDDRRRLIVNTRQLLHNLYKYQGSNEVIQPKKFKIKRQYDFNGIKKNTSADLLSLGSLISAIKGIGPKQTEK